MLSNRPASEKQSETAGDDIPAENGGDFEDLDGIRDVEFHTSRGGTADPDVSLDDASAEIAENILSGDFEDDAEYDDAPETELPKGGKDVDETVLEVLRNEAAFSSARAKLDAAVADNLDSDNVEADIPKSGAEIDGIDDLDAFLDALPDDDLTEPETQEEVEPEGTIEETDEEPDYDPLNDLDAIRRQLEEPPEEEIVLEPAQEYQAILPIDDDLDTAEDIDVDAVLAALGDDTSITEPEYEGAKQEDQEFDISDDPEVDEFEEYPPRRAFRADGAGLDLGEDTAVEPTDPLEPEDLPFFEDSEDEYDPSDQSGSAIPAAAALGAMRPRSSGGSLRARAVPDTEDVPEQGEATPVLDDQPVSKPTRPATDRRTARPGQEIEENVEETARPVSRKELLPDVEELNATLRGNVPDSTPNDEMEMGENQPVTKSFGKSFVTTLFVIALFVALYVMKPMIIAKLPEAAIALDPYVAFIDSIRLLIEQTVVNWLA